MSTYNSLSALAAPLRSVVGYTLAGANIYGPMDAGRKTYSCGFRLFANV